MKPMFSDLLDRADRLSATNSFTSRFFSATKSADASSGQPAYNVDHQMGVNLTEIFRASENLVKRRTDEPSDKDLAQLLKDAVKESDSEDITVDMWAQFTSMAGKRCNNDIDAVETSVELVQRATDYLHKSFIDHMQRCVQNNLEAARRGGIPGTRTLVAGYINACSDIASEIEDGCLGDGCPAWQVIYTCMRCGELSAASDALNLVAVNQRTNMLYKCLVYLKDNSRLTEELKEKLKVEWRHEQHSIRDLYRKGLYSALLGVESPIADTMENWLWFKLIPLRLDPHITRALYVDLQKTISIDYGVSYFMANGFRDAHIYFLALTLSGQFERAVDLLVETGHVSDAVHMAILAYENGLLKLTDPAVEMQNIKLLNTNPDGKSVAATVSLARLLVSYTKGFEMEDVETTLDYFYVLKGQKTAQGRDIFESAVSRVLYLTGNVKAVIGESQGQKRSKALIDNYDVDVRAIITRVAEDTELSGNPDQAVELLRICGQDDRAIEVMARRLSELITQNDESHRIPVLRAAEDLAKHSINASSKALSTLTMLLDIHGLLDRCRHKLYDEVMLTIRETRLIPTDQINVHAFTAQEHLMAPQVRAVLPDVCLAVMQCMADAFPEARPATRSDIKRQAQAIVVLAAGTNYKFPQNIISKLLSIQAKLQ
ncbi:unnamed protein product, partial [Mesorhabditis spiculigera]